MATAIRAASVPMVPSSMPPAGTIRTSGPAIWPASSAVPSAMRLECETTTSPTQGAAADAHDPSLIK